MTEYRLHRDLYIIGNRCRCSLLCIVLFLADSGTLMNNRPRPSQAVEYFAENTLTAQNEAYQRIQAGMITSDLIGDQPRWYADTVDPITFRCWAPFTDQSSAEPGTPNPLAVGLTAAMNTVVRRHSANESPSALEATKSASSAVSDRITGNFFRSITTGRLLG